MRKVLRRKPSASLVISLLALLLAASGTAVAASKLVSGDKLIKKHSLSGNRLKNKTLTGSQINLKKLGTVPKANYANSAGSASSASSATSAAFANRAVSSASTDNVKTWFVNGVAGQTNIPLLTVGPFSVYGACTGTAAAPHAQTWATTSQDGSSADSYANYVSPSHLDPWNTGVPYSIGYGSDEHVSDGSPQWVGPYDGSDTMISADGHTYVNTFASVGTLKGSAQCVFVGHAVVVTR